MSQPLELQPGETVPRVPCEKCNKPMLFGFNIDTRRDGPIDTHTTCYLVLKPRPQDKGKPRVMTAKKLLERMVSLRLNIDGQEVILTAKEIEGFFVSHWQTCPSASFISKNGGMSPKGKPRR
jgi:hypothetical protein